MDSNVIIDELRSFSVAVKINPNRLDRLPPVCNYRMHHTLTPPSILNTWPVINDAASLRIHDASSA
ncbi:hypothetical protein SAMN03080601_02113 [Alkalitalea saponilacus]|uniref:Uncharacterized protein n=1 Tax=Alkalitalea saponilacus TaxID=889453 RepID=A0A1T5H7A1_9BACT|nr:hypothetical protein SAMN03080601_02113 [Alkalitalea saponilacus]